MKTKIVTPGLVIREKPIGENDKLLAILTAENGLIRAFADGARRLKSKNAAATSLLSYCTFTLYKGKDTYKVVDAAVIDLFFELRYDLEGLALAQYFCEIALRQVPEGRHNDVFLRLLLNALFLLLHHKRPFELIKAVYELRFAAQAGYMPDLLGCSVCQKEQAQRFYFDFKEGCLFCSSCKRGGSGVGAVLNETVLCAMRHILYAPFQKIFSFTVPPADLKLLSACCEKYLSVQTEAHYKTLEFYRSICIKQDCTKQEKDCNHDDQ